MSSFSQNPYFSAMSQGGFVNDPPTDGTTPGGTKKFVQNTALRAVTTHQLLHHVQQTHGDAEFTLDNLDLGPVSLVALLHGVKVQATNTVFTLHDGWGQVEGRTWKDGNVDIDEEEEMNKVDGLEEGKYVYVVGQLKTLHNRKHLNITAIRPVRNFDEVLLHQLEVVSAYLYTMRGSIAPGGTQEGTKGERQDVVMHNVSAYQASGSGAVDSPAANLPLFLRIVFDAILANRGPSEGVHVATIARHIQNQKGRKASPSEVSDAIDQLLDEGLIYSTIDESHFDIAT